MIGIDVQFSSQYNASIVIYNHRAFIRLATGKSLLKKSSKSPLPIRSRVRLSFPCFTPFHSFNKCLLLWRANLDQILDLHIVKLQPAKYDICRLTEAYTHTLSLSLSNQHTRTHRHSLSLFLSQIDIDM